jgi:hypothetical protein
MVLSVVDRFTGTLDDETGIGFLSGVYVLAILVPAIALQVRRLHDTDRSGWWALIGFRPGGRQRGTAGVLGARQSAGGEPVRAESEGVMA